MKKIIFIKLAFFARRILSRYKPQVIAVTGSVGKTSSTQAIASVLGTAHSVRSSYKNYNNEIGLPLTIIGKLSPGKSITGWLGVFFSAIKLLIVKDTDYPEFLVLEVGIDRPGDMKHLASMIKPDLSVITYIGGSHLEYFRSQADLTKEKLSLIDYTKTMRPVLINGDNQEILNGMSEYTNVHKLSYGFGKDNGLKIEDLKYTQSEDGVVSNFTVGAIAFAVERLMSVGHLYSILSAIAVGETYDLSEEEIQIGVSSYVPPKGRMNLVKGIKNTHLIDDTYNSSPTSSMSAIDTISMLPMSKKGNNWAVFGDMLELGNAEEEKHKSVGEYALKSGFNRVVGVGELAKHIVSGAMGAGMSSDDAQAFNTHEEAIAHIKGKLVEGDVVLVKGSQGSRMEHVSKALLRNPEEASEVLVRQEDIWLK